MMNNKYVIINGMQPVIFSEMMSHNAFTILGKITGAGFVKIKNGDVYVYGRSLSLNMCSKPEDADTIKRMMRFE